MAKKIRFPLEMKNGVEVRDIEELRENFSLEQVLFYLSDGKLVTWLRDRYLNDIADAVLALNQEDKDFHKKICDIFEVEYVEEQEEDMEKAMERKRKEVLLKEFTDEEKFCRVADKIAFNQDDIYDLLDEGETTIYLCGDRFLIPLSKKGICYIGVNNPTAVISSKDKVDFEEKNISFQNIRFDEKYAKILSEEAVSHAEEEQDDSEDNCPEEVHEQIENLIDDLSECIDAFLERTLEKCMENWNEGTASNYEFYLSKEYYDDESYAFETKSKAKVACKEALQNFVCEISQEYESQRGDVINNCRELMESFEEDVMNFIEEFIESFTDFISLDCEGEAKVYGQKGKEIIADRNKMIKKYKDFHFPEKLEASIQEIFDKPIAKELGEKRVKEYLKMCEYDVDEYGEHCYFISEAVDSLADNITALFENACTEVDDWMKEFSVSILEGYCKELKENLSIMYSKKMGKNSVCSDKKFAAGNGNDSVRFGDYCSGSHLNFLLSAADRKGAEECYNKIRGLLERLTYDVDDDIRELREKLRNRGLTGMAESYLNSL